MENEELLQTDLAHPGIEEPHFDEEWTVLSARPVVPLEELDRGSRSRRILRFSGAFVGASLLGVLVALASIRIRETSQLADDADVPAQNNSGNVEQLIDDAKPPTEAAMIQDPNSVPLVSKTTAKVTERAKRPMQSGLPEEEEPAGELTSEPQKPRAQLVEQWQERRPRRILNRRPRREVDNLHHRDLLRIDEIFEGQRPEPNREQ